MVNLLLRNLFSTVFRRGQYSDPYCSLSTFSLSVTLFADTEWSFTSTLTTRKCMCLSVLQLPLVSVLLCQDLNYVCMIINEWMTMNFLKLNADKTEVVMLGFKAQLAKINLTSVNIAGVDIAIKSDPVKNLGVMFDCGLTMATQVANIARSANFQLVNIGRARKMLTTESTKLAVHTLVTSRLDYCNCLLADINRGLLKRLQNVQRTAARLITRKRKYDPISDDLIELHWLPVEQRIAFKILVLTYKAIHHQSPDYISSMLQLRTDSRHLRSTSFATSTCSA